jgi:hypothetical protein
MGWTGSKYATSSERSTMTAALPGTAPARGPAYPPPVPTGTPVDSGGADAATRAYRRQQKVADIYSRWRAAHSRDIPMETLKANAGAFAVSDAALTLPEALNAVAKDAEDAVARVNGLLKSSKVDNTDVAGQIAAQRFWNRTRRSLDALKDVPKLVAAAQKLVADADDSQIPVFSEELESYLASRNAPTGWLPGALAARIPGLGEANAARTLCERQLAVLAHNHAGLQNAFAKDVAAPPLMDPAEQTSTPYTDTTG